MALALNARDYKGLSGSSQMMTAAAICFSSMQQTDPKNEKSQIVSNQGNEEQQEILSK